VLRSFYIFILHIRTYIHPLYTLCYDDNVFFFCLSFSNFILFFIFFFFTLTVTHTGLFGAEAPSQEEDLPRSGANVNILDLYLCTVFCTRTRTWYLYRTAQYSQFSSVLPCLGFWRLETFLVCILYLVNAFTLFPSASSKKKSFGKIFLSNSFWSNFCKVWLFSVLFSVVWFCIVLEVLSVFCRLYTNCTPTCEYRA